MRDFKGEMKEHLKWVKEREKDGIKQRNRKRE